MSGKIVLITPDRNDRPELLDHCRYQMGLQTMKAEHLIINFEPKPGVVDIVPRVKEGIRQAQSLSAEYCLIIENDDYYPDNYIEIMAKYLDRFGIVGSNRTIYYSLQFNCLKIMNHPGRSSLFLTGFRIDALKLFSFPADTMLYFDIFLWENIKARKGFASFPYTPIGMKHGLGFTPGNFHNGIVNGKKMNGMMQDPQRKWLQAHTRKESFEFYQNFMQ